MSDPDQLDAPANRTTHDELAPPPPAEDGPARGGDPRPMPMLWRVFAANAAVFAKKTVERHRANILEKLGMRNRVDLTRYAIRAA